MGVADLCQGLLGSLFSAACPACGDGGHGGRVCGACFSELPRLAAWSCCAVCREPFAPGAEGLQGREVRCTRCLEGRAFAEAHALGPFGGPLAHLMHAVKFAGRWALGYDLGYRTGSELGEALGPVDRVVPIPLGPRRERERGYNQSAVLAEGVARALGVPVAPRLLERTRETEPQTSLSRSQRLRNVRGAFRATAGADGRFVLLVDDVYTTGATAEECARALGARGCSRVVVLTVARAVSRDLVGPPGSGWGLNVDRLRSGEANLLFRAHDRPAGASATMDEKKRNEYREKLRTKQVELTKGFRRTKSEATEGTSARGTEDFVDYAVSAYTKEFLLSLSDLDRRVLQQVDEALVRLKKGEYGTCLECGKEIGEKRLQAVPWTQYCISCQERIEQEESRVSGSTGRFPFSE